MNDKNLSDKNSTQRRTYFRRNRKGNRTTTILSSTYLPITTTLLTTNRTLIVNPGSVPVDDLFAPLDYLIEHKLVFLIVSSLLLLLCVITILFLVILKCSRGKNCKARRQARNDKKLSKKVPDFLVDQHDHKDESENLLEQNGTRNSFRNITLTTNGIIANDNISNTFSLDPLLEQKINRNNPSDTITSPSMADDTSLDTLRGSLISSPSQKISAIQSPPTPTQLTPLTTTDSIGNPDERALEAEKDDGLHDLDLTRIQTRYTKAINNNSSSSGSNLPGHRTSTSSLEQTIRRQERRVEEEERGLLHGSNSNIYEKEIQKRDEQGAFARKQHTNSQVSLVSRTSEDSCY